MKTMLTVILLLCSTWAVASTDTATYKMLMNEEGTSHVTTAMVTKFKQAATSQGVPLSLVVSICSVESGFDPKAKNRNTIGLCQINPRWHNTTRKRLLNYNHNIDKAVAYLAELQQQCHRRTACIIHSYNVGFPAYKSGKRNNTYYRKVVKARKFYEGNYGRYLAKRRNAVYPGQAIARADRKDVTGSGSLRAERRVSSGPET